MGKVKKGWSWIDGHEWLDSLLHVTAIISMSCLLFFTAFLPTVYIPPEEQELLGWWFTDVHGLVFLEPDGSVWTIGDNGAVLELVMDWHLDDSWLLVKYESEEGDTIEQIYRFHHDKNSSVLVLQKTKEWQVGTLYDGTNYQIYSELGLESETYFDEDGDGFEELLIMPIYPESLYNAAGECQLWHRDSRQNLDYYDYPDYCSNVEWYFTDYSDWE